MKRSIKTWALVAVAAMGLTACQNDIDEQIEAKDSVVVTFVADSADTRTSVDTSGDTPVFAWEDYEYFTVLEQTDALAMATSMGGNSVTYENVDGKAHISATFDYNAGKDEYKYVTVYPQFGYVKAESINAVTLMLPANQEMLYYNSYGDADLMVSEVVTTTEQPTEAQMVRFTRLAAVVQLSLKNLAEGENVESVIFEAEGKQLAGQIVADLENPHDFEAGDVTSSSVTVTPHHETTDNIFYFTVLPTTLAEGEAYTVTVVTDKHLYVKKGTIGEGKTLEFQSGMVTRVGVNMSGVTASDKWVLVTDVEELNGGDVVTFAAQNNDVVLGKQYGTTKFYASYTNVIKSGNYLYHPVPTAYGTNWVQPLTVVQPNEEENKFYFYNGVDYEGDENNGYLCAPYASQSYLLMQAYENNNTLFTVSIVDGVTSVVAESSEGLSRYLQYKPAYSATSTSRYFQCETEALKSGNDNICIYKLEGGVGVTIPTSKAAITVPDTDEPVVIEKEGAEDATFEEVKFNYVGDWTIDVSAKVKDSEDVAEWLAFTYADGALTYTAEANEGEVRYATVTITATLDGEEDIVKSFEVIQKGAPKTISIAEFVKLSTDANVEYIITGRITTLATSTSGTYKITDGTNTVSISYLYQEGNVNPVYGNVDLKFGDVITVRTTVTGSAKGGSSSVHAIYLGYYNISATSEIGSCEGGKATITITKEGNLIPEVEFEGKIDVDFATLTLPNAENANAVVTFEANNSYARQAVVTLTYGLATAEVVVVQGATTDPLKRANWTLVTDVKDLAEKDIVAVVAQDYDQALSTTISSNRRSATAISKVGNYLVANSDVQELVLIKGTVDGTFAFYDATQKGFIASTSTSTGSSSKLLNQAYNDENSSFAINIAEGATTIGNVSGTYLDNAIYYNTSYGFVSYKSTGKAVCLYKLVGVQGEIPVIAADVTVPETYVTIAEEGATEATAIDAVEFNYVGDWTISVSDNADWLTVAYDAENSKVTYTAEANDGVAREATVTITATKEGQEAITWEFTMLQKGAPVEVSIAEFLTKEVSADVVYKLTGKVTSISTSNNGTYTLDGGNGKTVEIRYLYLEGGSEKLYDSDIVKVGDIVTVTAVVATKGEVGGTSANKSIYKGRYRLTAEASGAVGYEGGSATIDVKVDVDGVMENVPTAISTSEVNVDGVTYNFSDNGDGTATASMTFGANETAPRAVEATYSISGTHTGVTYTSEATVTIAQDINPASKSGWWLVLDAKELQTGDKIIIAATGMNYAISTATNTSTRKSTTITKNGYQLGEPSSDVQQYALEVDANGLYSFKGTIGTDAGKYIYASSSSSNYMKVSTTLDDNGKFTISIDGTGAATVIAQGSNTRNHMQYNNKATSTPAFYCTDGSFGAVCFYKYFE